MPATAQVIAPADVARYFLYRATEVGDLITNLKMQKLVYYAYAWTLVKHGERLFEEPIQAWPNGPVVPSLYRQLKQYGYSPIGEEFIDAGSEEELLARFPPDVLETLAEVYENYGTKSAFELVVSTHHEKPWMEARKGLGPTERSERPLNDRDIREEFAARSMEDQD